MSDLVEVVVVGLRVTVLRDDLVDDVVCSIGVVDHDLTDLLHHRSRATLLVERDVDHLKVIFFSEQVSMHKFSYLKNVREDVELLRGLLSQHERLDEGGLVPLAAHLHHDSTSRRRNGLNFVHL